MDVQNAKKLVAVSVTLLAINLGMMVFMAATKAFNSYTVETVIDAAADKVIFWDNDEGAVNLVVPNNLVTEGTVTQHEAAIDHDALTNFVAGEHFDLTDKASLEAELSDAADLAEADGDTYTGTHDFSGSTLTLPGTVKLTDLTDNFLPYHVSDAAGLADSPVETDGTSVGIGGSPSALLHLTIAGEDTWTPIRFSGPTGSSYQFGRYDVSNLDSFGVSRVGQSPAIVMNPAGDVGFGDTTPDFKVEIAGSLGLQEQAAADADEAGTGQLWVKSDTPNTLWFTDDAGTDTQLGTGGSSVMTPIVCIPRNATTALSGGLIQTNNASYPHDCVLLDDTTDEDIEWYNLSVEGYQSGTLKADIYWSAASGVSADCVLQVKLFAYTPGDTANIDTVSFSDSWNTELNATAPAVAGRLVKTTITLSETDNTADGDILAVRLNRDADNGMFDDLTGDIEVRMVVIYEE